MIHLRKPARRAQVVFYAGHRAAVRPLSFRAGRRHLHVTEVISQHYEDVGTGQPRLVFQVRAEDGRVYRIAGCPDKDDWKVRRLPGAGES